MACGHARLCKLATVDSTSTLLPRTKYSPLAIDSAIHLSSEEVSEKVHVESTNLNDVVAAAPYLR